ncbi:MAG: ribonuclease III domain-containing protein [Bacilli bacterium]
MNINSINVQVLAYIGDAIYEIKIREDFIKLGINKVNDLQKEVTKHVCAFGQAETLNFWIVNNVLSEEELSVMRRAKNYKTASKPKNVDIITYKKATAFEAIIGYLYLENKIERLNEILTIKKEI